MIQKMILAIQQKSWPRDLHCFGYKQYPIRYLIFEVFKSTANDVPKVLKDRCSPLENRARWMHQRWKSFFCRLNFQVKAPGLPLSGSNLFCPLHIRTIHFQTGNSKSWTEPGFTGKLFHQQIRFSWWAGPKNYLSIHFLDAIQQCPSFYVYHFFC